MTLIFTDGSNMLLAAKNRIRQGGAIKLQTAKTYIKFQTGKYRLYNEVLTHMQCYGTPKLSYVVIFLVVLSKNCVNLSMHYVIILKTRVILSIYNVDMPTHCLIMLKNHFILSQRGVILSKKHVNLSI